MPKTYEYNGEIFTYEDMLEAYGDDAGVQNAVKQFGIKEQGSIQEDIPVTPGKKKTVVAKGATATGQKNGASKKATGSSVSPKQIPSNLVITPGVNDFGAQLVNNQKPQSFKEYGQSQEYKKQQVEKNKALNEQKALDEAKWEAKHAAAAVRRRKQSEAHSRFLEYTKPNQEQLSELDLEIKNELSRDGEIKETTYVPKSDFQVPYTVKTKYTAFSNEKAEIIAELKKNQTLDKYNDNAIRELAVQRYRKKKLASIYDNNAKDFMEDATDEEQAELKKASEEASINAAKQAKYKALLNQRIEKNVKAAIPKLQAAGDDLKQYTKDYKFKSKEEYEEYKSKFDYYNDLRNTVVGLQSAQEENLKSLDKSQEDLQTAEQEFDVFKRHYGAGNLILKPAAAFKSLFTQIIGFGSLVADFSTIPGRYLYSKTIGDDDFEYVSDTTKTIARYNQYSEEFWNNYFQKTVEITDAESLGEYSFDLLANQLPNLALMALSGGGSAAARTVATEVVGKVIVEQATKSTLKKAASWTMNKMALDPALQLMAAGSAGGKYLENVRSNDIGETNYNPIQMVASSLLWGYAEALGEKVTVDILKGSGRTLDALLKGDTGFVQKTLKQRSVDFFKDKGIDFLNENVSEQATNLIQNSVNKFILGQNVGLLDNTGRVFKDTALLTGMLQSAPHIIGAAVKPFLPKDETLTVKDNALKIAKYMNLLKDNSLSFAESTAIEQKIKDLTDSSSEIMKGLIKRIGDMPPSDYDKVINLSKELADLKMQATEIYNSDSSNKEQLIKDLKDKHDSKKRELNKLVQETKILSKLDGNYTVQEKRDLYDLEVKAKNLEKEIEGKDGVEVLSKKEELKQIREKQNNIFFNSMFTTQGKGVSAINEVLKSKGLSGIEVTNVNTVEEAIEQHDKLLAKLVEAGELTEAKAKAQKATFLKTIKSAEAVNANINGTDYIYNIKERIDNEGVFAHEPGHSIFDRLVSKNPEDYKEIHDALLDHVKTIFGKSTRQNEKNALEYILAGVKAYQQHATDTKQDYAYDELLQVVGDALQKYNIGMESMDPNFLQRLGEKIKEFLRKVLKIQNVDDIVKFDTGKDVYDFIKEYRRTFRKGELSKGVKAALEKGSIEGKLIKKPTAKQNTKPLTIKFDQGSKASLKVSFEEKFQKLTNSKEYINFTEKLKKQKLFHSGSQGIERSFKQKEAVAIWFTVDKAEPNYGDGVIYETTLNDMPGAIIIPDINRASDYAFVFNRDFPEITEELIKDDYAFMKKAYDDFDTSYEQHRSHMLENGIRPGVDFLMKDNRADEVLEHFIKNIYEDEDLFSETEGYGLNPEGNKVGRLTEVIVMGNVSSTSEVNKIDGMEKSKSKFKAKYEIKVKPSLTIVEDHINKTKKTGLTTPEFNDLLNQLENSIENYWDYLSDKDTESMYSKIDSVRDRLNEKNKVFINPNNKGAKHVRMVNNLTEVKNLQKFLNNYIRRGTKKYGESDTITKPSLQIKSKNPIELKRKIQILKDFTDNRLPSLLLGKETGDKADAILLNKIKGFLTISKNTLKYSGIDTSELESYIFDIAKSVRDQEFTTKEIQTKLAEDFELDLSKNRLDAISEQDIQGKIDEILEEDKSRKDKQFEDLSEDDIRNLAIEMVSAEKVFTSSYVLKKGSRRGKKMEQSQFDQEIRMFKADFNRLAYLLGERFHKTDILKKIAIGSGGIFDATGYDQFSSKFKFKKVINDKRLKSIEAYKAVGIEPMKNNIGKVISDFFDKRQKINSGDIDMASRRAAMKEFGTDTQRTLSDFTGEQRVALDKRIQEIADELTKKRQVDTNASVDLTLAEKVELGNSIKETLSKVLSKNNEDSIKDAGAYFFETLFNQYLESEDKFGYLRFISTMMSLMSSNGTAISRQLAFPRFFSITPGYFIKTSKRTGKQSVQQFHYEHPLKSITFLSNMLDAIKHSSSMEEFKSKYDELMKNYHGFVMNKNDQQIFDADGYTTYSPEFKGNELPISDYSYKVGKDYDVLYIEPGGRVVSLDDFYKTEMFKKEINESINDAVSNTVKPSLRIVSDYTQNNQPKKIPTSIALDLLGELHRGVENYWGKVSDENVGVMYQNIEYATEIVNEREEDKNPFMKAVNEGLNLVTIKDTERRLNDVISDVSVKASLSFNKLVLQDEKRELIKVNTDIASKYKSGQTKSEEDQTTINNNIARVREINDFLNKPEGEAIKGVSEKNQKISERNSALMKIFKDPEVDERTKEKVKMDLLANNMGLIYNLSKRYWDYQQDETAFTQDDLKEELILQFFELIRTYNPEKNDNFGAYLNGILPRRIPRILENIGTVKTKAGQERAFGNQLSDEGAKQLTSEEEEDLHDKVAKRRVNLTEAMGMEPSTVKDIETKLIRILNSKIPNVNSKEFKQYMQREIRLDITAILRREFGIKTDYAYYINKYWKVLYDALPISVMNKRFQEFTEPVLDNYGRQEFVQIKEDGKSWRNGVTRKKDIDKAYFYGYFLGQYVGLTTRSTRKTALIDTIAEEISFDMTMDLFANNEEFRSKFEEKQEFLGNELAPNYLSEIAKQLDRDTPTTKASLWAKNWLKDNGLFPSQGISILNQMADISRRTNAYDSLITKLIDKNPKFKEFIEYFSEKIKSYLTKAKIVLMEKVARMSNKELLLSSTAFSKEQVSKMSNTKIIDELNKLDKDLNESRVKASFGQWAFMDLGSRFNSILEQRTGIPAGEKYSPATAYVKGRGKGKFRFFLPPDAEDFSGLLYSFLPFGENGERAWHFFQDNLIQPFSSAINNYDKEKMQMIRDYKELKNVSGIKNSTLRSTIYSTNYTIDQAIRLYLWNRQGEDIKMIPKNELEIVVEFVRARPELKEYAEQLAKITKRKLGYVPYNNSWLGGTISTDIIDYMNGERREFHLEIWQSHVDEIFSPENLDKVQAIYGLNFRNALESSLHRMKTGRNINNKSDAKSNRWLEWINGANANIMFLNTRSALLQLTATINYIDMEINNPVAAARAFANQIQFWQDFVMLWNEDYLLDRRGGLRFDVSADDIATAASGKNGFKKLIAKISEAGFAPTKYADSISATLGGASFYRNHYNHYLNIGYTEEEAHDQAISDWSERTETTNQSARPDKVSQIQSTNIGRLVFAFGNTSMQYNRLMKRAFLDIINKRGDWKKNAAKIIYYGAINNMIFSFLQNALFASIFGDDDEQTEEKSIYEDQALASTVDGILDSLLKGSGMYGAIASTAKNMWQKWYEMELSGRKNPHEVPLEILSISPAFSSKMNKLVSAGRTFIYKQEIEKSKQAGWSLDNPAYGSAAKVLSVVYNVPADRIFQKIENLRLASDSSLETWQRTMLLLGYNKYNLNIKEKEQPIDVLSKSDRETFETYKKVEPALTEEKYMEMKNLEPKVRPVKKNKKTWLNIFNPRLKQEMAKDPLTKAQRKTFEKYKAVEPALTVKDFIKMNNISIREGSNVEEFEKISQELEERKAQEEETINIKNREE